MNTIQNLFEQAQLAEAAYADFANYPTTAKALEAEGMSKKQADEFVTRWTVVDQYRSPGLSLMDGGFSATLFRNIDTDAYSFAIRGTVEIASDLVGADFGDIVMDGVVMDQVVDMYNYWQSLNHVGNYQAAKLETSYAETAALNLLPPGSVYDAAMAAFKQSGAILDSTLGGTLVRRIVPGDSTTLLAGTALEQGSGKLTDCPALDVTGHSLGGHLAAAFTRLFPGIGAKAIAFDGAGFPTGLTPGLGGNALSNIQNLFAELKGAATFDPASIQNVRGDAPSMVTMDSQYGLVQPGSAPLEIYIESMDASTAFGHRSGQMTDSLALYALFAQIDPSLNTSTLGTITAILKASANIAANSLEAALAAMGKIYGKTFVGIEASRDDFYTNLYNLEAVITGTGTVVAIGGDVSGQAKTDIAYRYALTELNPFAITGNDGLYAQFNENGELDRYDPATGTGNLTDLQKEWKGRTNSQSRYELALR
jgi:pimeloyl-ACP methyl ester carboxylesterase